MDSQTDLESQFGDPEIRKSESIGWAGSWRAWKILCPVMLFVLLGVWSFTHQVSFEPPSAEGRSAVLRRIRALQVVPLDEVIVPKEGSLASWILGDGFTQAEIDGAWMTALNASLNFSIDSWTRVPRSMTLTFVPLLGPTRPNRTLTVSAGGASVTETIAGRESITIGLNGELRQAVNISCDSVDSANGLRVGPDFRPMCVKLISFVVKSS